MVCNLTGFILHPVTLSTLIHRVGFFLFKCPFRSKKAFWNLWGIWEHLPHFKRFQETIVTQLTKQSRLTAGFVCCAWNRSQGGSWTHWWSWGLLRKFCISGCLICWCLSRACGNDLFFLILSLSSTWVLTTFLKLKHLINECTFNRMYIKVALKNILWQKPCVFFPVEQVNPHCTSHWLNQNPQL